jgi:hypothetical protein
MTNLVVEFGPIVSGETLRRLLGYKTEVSFRMARYRGTLPVPVFRIEHRTGLFALTEDIEAWLVSVRVRSRVDPPLQKCTFPAVSQHEAA